MIDISDVSPQNGLTGFEHISVAFGIQSCTMGCANNLGTMLFAGNYTPESHQRGEPQYQNFVSQMRPRLLCLTRLRLRDKIRVLGPE